MQSQAPHSAKYRVYRFLLRLYPRAHRQEYAEPMLQTFDDIMHDQTTPAQRASVWLRVAKELPSNLIEEHIHNLENIHMGTQMTKNSKRNLTIGMLATVLIISVAATIILTRHQQFTPMTLSSAQKSGNGTACLQKTDNARLNVPDQSASNIAAAAATSIIDVPAGTNVEVNLKTYGDNKATGTAMYAGTYGNYNFEATKTDGEGEYAGGWHITTFRACD